MHKPYNIQFSLTKRKFSVMPIAISFCSHNIPLIHITYENAMA